MELTVYYSGPINTDLDKKLEEVLRNFGLKRWASGMDLVNHIRDLAFDSEDSPVRVDSVG